MTAIALHLVAAVGATLIVVRGTIFRSLRSWWPSLLACSQCTGFWVGAAFGAIGIGSASLGSTWVGRVEGALLTGCEVSFLSVLADAILLKLLGDPNEP